MGNIIKSPHVACFSQAGRIKTACCLEGTLTSIKGVEGRKFCEITVTDGQGEKHLLLLPDSKLPRVKEGKAYNFPLGHNHMTNIDSKAKKIVSGVPQPISGEPVRTLGL